MTRPVDAIVLEYHLGLLDGGFVAAEMKKVSPTVPILMLIDHLEVPDGALKSVDMVVAKIDGDDFLLSAVRYVLGERPASVTTTRSSIPARSLSRENARAQGEAPTPLFDHVANHEVNADPFSPEAWQSILNGTVRFESASTDLRGKN